MGRLHIGGGQTGEAIIRGLLKAGLCIQEDIYVMDILDSRLQYLHDHFQITNSSSDKSTGYRYLVEQCDIILLAIKPGRPNSSSSPSSAEPRPQRSKNT